MKSEQQCLAIGLDNTQPKTLRLVDLCAERLLRPWPGAQLHRFKSLDEFQAYWSKLKPEVYPAVLVATTSLDEDPFGCLAWLTGQVIIRRYGRYQLPSVRYFEPEVDEDFGSMLPRPYLCAFTLAIQAAYDLAGARSVEGLWREIAELQEGLRRFERVLKRATEVVPYAG